MKSSIQTLALGAVLGSAITLSIGAAGGNNRQSWEYQLITEWKAKQHDPPQTFMEAINVAGEQGWEVVSFGRDSNNNNDYVLAKRPR
jgi:hypothetical protein